jgi:ribonuclease E
LKQKKKKNLAEGKLEVDDPLEAEKENIESQEVELNEDNGNIENIELSENDSQDENIKQITEDENNKSKIKPF